MELRAGKFVLPVMAMAFVLGCGGGDGAGKGDDDDHESTASGSAAATGDTIIVEMHSDGTGNYYKPKDIEAEQGDVVRFVLKSGVHNVNFFADSNRIKTALPTPSDMLQIPDQTWDLVVNMQEGHYYFQCDPHAALGMTGTLEVEDD